MESANICSKRMPSAGHRTPPDKIKHKTQRTKRRGRRCRPQGVFNKGKGNGEGKGKGKVKGKGYG